MKLAAWPLLKQSIAEWVDDKCPTYAASLAYYTVFSLAPTLLIAVSVAGAIYGPQAVRGEMAEQLAGIVGEGAAKTIEATMASAAIHTGGTLATVIGVLVLMFAATGVFGELQSALNTIFKVKPRTTNSVLAFLRTRFVSFTMVMGIGFLLLVSLVASAGLAAFGSWVGGLLPVVSKSWDVVNLLVSMGGVTLLFAMMFKLLPDVKLEWRDVWVGAFLSASLFNLGKLLISIYLARSAIASSYGAAGSLAALLVWVYYSSMILLFGAELSQVYARHRGSLQGKDLPPTRRAPRQLNASAFDAWRTT